MQTKKASDLKANVYGKIKTPPFIFLKVIIVFGLCLFGVQIITVVDIYVSLQKV